MPGAIDEPLDISAPLAWAEAPRLCAAGRPGEPTCLPYHRIWQYLRLLGVISTVRTNSTFFTGAFEACARDGAFGRVIVSGAADYALLAHLAHAYRTGRAPLRVSVVDLCETPLFLNRWYAARAGLDVDTARSDVLEFSPAQPADLICTHNFLGRFDSGARRELIARWAAWLRPGGLVVTTQRVRPGTAAARVAYTRAEAEALGERVAAAARAHGAPLGIEPGELARVAVEYAAQKDSHPIADAADVAAAFEREGFVLLQQDQGDGLDERRRDRPASTAGTDTYRMRLVARRR